MWNIPDIHPDGAEKEDVSGETRTYGNPSRTAITTQYCHIIK